MMTVRNKRTVDLSDIEENMRLIRSATPESAKVMAVVKADGYGHGAVTAALASLAGGAEALAVATVEEGAELRKAGITAPILVLGAVEAGDAGTGLRNALTMTVCSPEMVRICETEAEKLCREYGFGPEDARNRLIRAFQAMQGFSGSPVSTGG